MNRILSIIAIIASTINIGTSQPSDAVRSQKYYEEKKKVFFPKERTLIKLLKDNWGMYFKEDVVTKLDAGVKETLYEIKLDSYGSIYPDKAILQAITQSNFEGGNKSKKYLSSHSFLYQFRSDGGEIEKAISKSENPKIYTSLLLLSKSKKKLNEELFFDRWDSLHNYIAVTELNRQITEKKIKKVIFFIHGYNVPYSLAALQAISVYKTAKDTLKVLPENTMLVPIYWPSNNAKLDSLRQENFTTENIKTYSGNGALFLRYSNRCYYAAITLRKILNGLDSSVSVYIIAHSLGATIPTTCFINTYSKLDYNKFSRLRNIAYQPDKVLNANKENFRGKDYINIDILQRLYKTPIPDRQAKIFLSAPAIPGLSTFKDAEYAKLKNKFFYVSINYSDEMVTKNDIRNEVKSRFYVNISAINSCRLSSTTLGCNGNGDAEETELYFKNNLKLPDNFNKAETSREWDHDIFTYLQQQNYRAFLRSFLDNK